MSLANLLSESRLYQQVSRRSYQVVYNPVHSRKLHLLETDEEKYEVKKVLTELAQLFSTTQEWVLSGGLAIPATINDFYRKHRAIHLGVAAPAFENFLATALQQEYLLFRRTLDMHLSPHSKIDVYHPLSYKEITQQRLPRNLRLIKTIDTRGKIHPHTNILDYIDIYVHSTTPLPEHSNDDLKLSATYSDYFGGSQYVTPQGTLRLVNIRYLQLLKTFLYAKRKEKRDKLDLKKIKRWLSRE